VTAPGSLPTVIRTEVPYLRRILRLTPLNEPTALYLAACARLSARALVRAARPEKG